MVSGWKLNGPPPGFCQHIKQRTSYVVKKKDKLKCPEFH